MWEYKTEQFKVERNSDKTCDDILNEFEMFLRGAGFHFEGRLDIVNEDEWNEDNDGDEEFQTTQTGSWEWTVNSLMNPPKFRANGCEVCGLDKSMMKSHNCYDDNCPVHAPKSVNASEA